MNKIIYAIGIAVASTFASNIKPADTKANEKEILKIEQVEKLPIQTEADSLKVEL